MNAEILTTDDAAIILRAAGLISRASIVQEKAGGVFDWQVVKFTLASSTAQLETNPIRVSFPFKSLKVMKMSHPNLIIKMKPNTDDSFQSALELRNNDSLIFQNPVSGASFFWDSQAVGGSAEQNVYVIFSVSAEFRSGTISIIGGVKTDMYQSVIHLVANLVAAAAASNLSDPVVLGQVAGVTLGTTDRQLLLQNRTGGILYVGNSASIDDGTGSAGAFQGINIQDGDFFKWNNKSSLYGYAVSTGPVITVIEY